MNSKLVLAVIVILLLLYVIFKALTTTYTSLGAMQKWVNETTLQGSNLPSSFKANSAIGCKNKIEIIFIITSIKSLSTSIFIM
jgi:hypothetical protein